MDIDVSLVVALLLELLALDELDELLLLDDEEDDEDDEDDDELHDELEDCELEPPGCWVVAHTGI